MSNENIEQKTSDALTEEQRRTNTAEELWSHKIRWELNLHPAVD